MADQPAGSGGYTNFPYIVSTKGLQARYAPDHPQPGSVYEARRIWLLNADRMQVRLEAALSSGLGLAAITVAGSANVPLADTNIHTLGRLKGLSNTFRYAGAGTNLYRRAGDGTGAFTNINGSAALSGNRFSMVVYRPDFSSAPYVFFADTAQMLKDNGSFSPAQNWGIFPPTVVPTVTLLNPSKLDIELFEATGPLTFTNYTGGATANRVNTTLSSPISAIGRQVVTPASMSNIEVFSIIRINSGGGSDERVVVTEITATTFTAVFVNTHLAAETVTDVNVTGAVAASTTGAASRSVALNLSAIAGVATSDDDLITGWVNISNPTNVTEIRVFFDVGDGSFTQDYYTKAVTPDTLQSFVDTTTTAQVAVTNRIFDRAGGRVDTRGFVSLDGPDAFTLPQDDPSLQDVQPDSLNTGLSSWSLLQLRLGDFLAVGVAGNPGKTWANVNAWKIQVLTNSSGSITLQLDKFYLAGASGLDVFAGVNYDYRVTYFNINTGAESNPSQAMVSASWVAPRRQPTKIAWSASTDTQVTHVRVYRRGGTLSTGWKKVAEVAIGTNSFTDTVADSVIITAKALEIDNDPPVTSLLATVADTTLSAPATALSTQTVAVGSIANLQANQYVTIDQSTAAEETVLLQSASGGNITAYFQYAHASGARVFSSTKPGTALNLATLALRRAWLAGDPNNPHVLYYSKIDRPESFPPQNTLEVGTPSDPIMAIIENNGQLYVATRSTWYQIAQVNTPVPFPLKTASRYGLAGNFAWTLANNEIFYLSGDGIYAFRGGQSVLMSEMVSWLVDGLTLGPVVPMDKTQRNQTVMAFYNKEVYISYLGTDGARKRLIYDLIYTRWRNGSLPITAMLYEEDTYSFLVAKADGMVYQDQVNDYDDAGFSGGVAVHNPIAFNFQTCYEDQGIISNQKVYQDLTIDIDTGNQSLVYQLIFDNGKGPTLTLATPTPTTGRNKLQFNINAGLGQLGYNFSLKITGSVTSPVHIYQVDIGATVEAEQRQSYDSYWMKFGTDELKTVKQGYFEYSASDPAGVQFSMYIEGNVTSPQFTFTLPAASVRTAKRARFPAIKAKTWRLIGTSSSDFQFYPESGLEVKAIGSQKGYAQAKLTP